ncbi:MAG: amidohydrolase family protein [Nitrososphaerales archaeon]
MIIDCHNHILAAGLYPGYERFIKEMTCGFFQDRGELPSDREPTEEEWEHLHYLWDPIDPDVLISDHQPFGIDRCTILGVAPSDYTRYAQRGTADVAGVTGIPGPPTIEKGNDYIAAVAKKYPDYFIPMAAVNPRYRGVKYARDELERAVTELGIKGLKLYPTYDHYSADDPELGMPIFEKAMELDIAVMVHLSTTPVSDTVLAYGRPITLDEVARRLPDLRLLMCHAGWPWTDECLIVASRHRNMHLDVSFFNSVLTRRETFDFLHRAKRFGCRWTKICFGTDYPGFEMPKTLLPKFALVNEEAGDDPSVPDSDLARMLGGNYARFVGLDWEEAETIDQLHARNEMWRGLWAEEQAEAGQV